jgi:hypothetical protein
MAHRVVLGLTLLLFSAGARAATDAAQTPSPQVLLDRWEQALSHAQTCAMNCELVMMEDYSWKPRVTWRRITESCYREDNGKFNLIYRTAYDLPTPDAILDPTKVQDSQLLWDGTQLYTFHSTSNPQSALLIFHPLTDTAQIDDVRRSSIGSQFDARLLGERVPLPQLMRAMNLEVDDAMADVNGVPCYLIRASGDYGKLKVWIDPQHGYNYARVERHAAGHDVYCGQPLPRPSFTNGASMIGCYEIVETTRFEQINGEWFQMEMHGEGMARFENGQRSRGKTTLKRTHLDLAPDFEKLDAFALHVPDGTRVETDGFGGVPLVWRAGKAVPKIDAATTRAIDQAIASMRSSSPTTAPVR